jgi:hypothetical protein
MSLEDEALKGSTVTTRSAPQKPRPFDWAVRVIATILLFGVLTVVYWVPMQLLGGFASALVLAALTMVGAAVASRLYHLRIRVETLETLLEGHDHALKDVPAVDTTMPKRHEQNRLEEIQKEP